MCSLGLRACRKLFQVLTRTARACTDSRSREALVLRDRSSQRQRRPFASGVLPPPARPDLAAFVGQFFPLQPSEGGTAGARAWRPDRASCVKRRQQRVIPSQMLGARFPDHANRILLSATPSMKYLHIHLPDVSLQVFRKQHLSPVCYMLTRVTHRRLP